jgi:hypothetical protein
MLSARLITQYVKPERYRFEQYWTSVRGEDRARRELTRLRDEPQCYVDDDANRAWKAWEAALCASH